MRMLILGLIAVVAHVQHFFSKVLDEVSFGGRWFRLQVREQDERFLEGLQSTVQHPFVHGRGRPARQAEVGLDVLAAKTHETGYRMLSKPVEGTGRWGVGGTYAFHRVVCRWPVNS